MNGWMDGWMDGWIEKKIDKALKSKEITTILSYSLKFNFK